MANNHIRAAYVNQHGRRDLASVGPRVLPEQVLRCQAKRGGAKLVLQRCQRRKRRGNHHVERTRSRALPRQGSNEFHGSGYFFFRDHNMAAYPGLKRLVDVVGIGPPLTASESTGVPLPRVTSLPKDVENDALADATVPVAPVAPVVP